MDKVTGKLTVFFEEPFWAGVFERTEGGKLSACKVIFGTEPKDYEIQAFILEKYYDLVFSPSVEMRVKERCSNPKKRQREVKKQTLTQGSGTKSQQALKLQREEMKTHRKVISKEMRRIEQERRYELKRQKRKEKHRGR